MKNLKTLINEHQLLELQAHVWIDDVLLKINQEVAELLKAISENNKEEIKKEAQDVLVNILSFSAHIGMYPTEDRQIPELKGKELEIYIENWNRRVWAIRKRYSRDDGEISTFQKEFEDFSSGLLSLSWKENYSEVVQSASEKFRGRVLDYLPKVNLQDYIAEYPNFPKAGILFRDISPLLQNPEALRYACFEIAKNCKDADVIAGLDARGFLFGLQVATILWKPFVMIRKKGKLPGETESISYGLEYGSDTIEIQKDVFKVWQKVAIIDDLLATGGTALAAANLIEKVGGEVDSVNFLISLDDAFLSAQNSRKELGKYSTNSVLRYK